MTIHDYLVLHIRSATDALFTNMFGMPIEIGEAKHEVTRTSLESGVAAVVGMSGRHIGTGTLSCNASSACILAGLFLGRTYAGVDDDVMDGIGEMSNMIIGGVKNELGEEFGPLSLGTPTVIHGRNYSTRTASPNGWTVVPFKLGEARFTVQATLAPNTVPHMDATRPARMVLGMQR
jgi:CheY-specific phosphatase CheX